MRTKPQWFDALHDTAPRVGDPLLHTLAALLARTTDPGALLFVSEALMEAAEAQQLANCIARSTDLRRLAFTVAAGVPERDP